MITTKLIIAGLMALSLFGGGYWVGKRVEIANKVEAVETALEDQRSAFELASGVQEDIHQREIDGLRASIRRAESRAKRNQQIAAEEIERSRSLRERVDELAGRFSGDSVCSFEPADVGLLRESIEAANASLGVRLERMPGAGQANGAGGPEGSSQ